MICFGPGWPCRSDDCTTIAEVGDWCVGHAIGRYVKATHRRDPVRIVPVLPACSFDGCLRVAYAGDELCGAHLRQRARRGTLTLIAQRRSPGAALVRDEHGRKECGRCLQWLDVGEFNSHPVQGDGLQPSCAGCTRRDAFNVSPSQYGAMLERQGGTCAVCDGVDASGKRLAIDHDHQCCRGWRSCGKCVRGLLCTGCNQGLGFMGDSPSRIRAAIDYLEAWRTRGPRTVGTRPADLSPKGAYHRWYHFRLTMAEYASTLAEQGGTCALCPRTSSGARSLSIDHDHTCCPVSGKSCGRCVRGLLCSSCNSGLGSFHDDAARLRAAADYLDRHAARPQLQAA